MALLHRKKTKEQLAPENATERMVVNAVERQLFQSLVAIARVAVAKRLPQRQ